MNPFPFYRPPMVNSQPFFGITAPHSIGTPMSMERPTSVLLPVPSSVIISNMTVPPPPMEKAPVTTVFVGNIADSMADSVIKEILVRCGNILKWKRVQGPTGKLQAFGFCEYDKPESTMRCVRLLNGLSLHDKPLLVKLDSKTEEILDEYTRKNMKNKAGESDDERNSIDEKCRASIREILDSNPKSHNGQPTKNGTKVAELDWNSMEDMNLDADKRNVIEREVAAFRSKFERQEEEPSRPRKNVPSAIGAAAMKMAPDSVNIVELRDQNRRKERSRSRSPRRSERPSGTITAFPNKNRASSREKERERDPEEVAVRRRLERKLREKEESYKRLLDDWADREHKKTMDFDRESARDQKKQDELLREAERLREFFADYNDEEEDARYYKGTAYQRRLAARESEKAMDERDRQREMEQIEIARQKLMDEQDPNAESIILQMEQKMQEHLVPRLNLEAPEPITVPPLSVVGASHSRKETVPALEQKKRPDMTMKDPMLFTMSETAARSRRPNQIFEADARAEEEEEAAERDRQRKQREEEENQPKPAKYVPGWLPPSAKQQAEEAKGGSSASISNLLSEEEKKVLIRDIIKRIPTEKDLLFAFPLEWSMVDLDFVNTHIRPWVDKKMVDYIGDSEDTLSKFICDQVLNHNPPAKIQNDVAMVLDDEAEGFVVKLWRLLIYVIAAKKAGLT